MDYKKQFVLSILLACVLSVADLNADTWQLQKTGSLRKIESNSSDAFTVQVAQIKKLVNQGKTKNLKQQLENLKKQFPQIAGADLDAFIDAEKLYADGNYVKAVRAYEALLDKYPESSLYQAALERQYEIATAFLDGYKVPVLKVFKIKGYAQGEKVMDNIRDRAGNNQIGLDAAVAVARSLEKRKKFLEAHEQWAQIASDWPTGVIAKQALLAMARCQHAAYRGPKFGSSNLTSAKTYYQNYQAKYPVDAKKFKIDQKIEKIDRQLAYKNYSVAKYYKKTGNIQAANYYFQMVVDNWPDTNSAKMAKEMLEGKNLKGKKVKK